MENDENTPLDVGRYTATTRLPKRPIQQTRVPWHRRKPKQKAAPKPSNLIPKVASAKIVLRRVRKAAMNNAAAAAIKTVWGLAQDLVASHEVDRTPAWWYRYILQMARKGQSKRDINLWNVYLHKEVRVHNDGTFIYCIERTITLLISFVELPADEECLTAPKYIAQLREVWNKMSKTERIEATKDAVEDVKEMRKSKETTVHNVPIAAFHDVRANVRSMEHNVSPRSISSHSPLTGTLSSG